MKEPVAVETTRNHEALLAKQDSEVMVKMSLLNLSGSILTKTTLMKRQQRRWCTQTAFLSKQVPTIVASRRRDAQTIEILGAYIYTSKVI